MALTAAAASEVATRLLPIVIPCQVGAGAASVKPTTDLMRREVAPLLFRLSKCPDFVEDRGHDFGTKLSDADKRALIEFLKTL